MASMDPSDGRKEASSSPTDIRFVDDDEEDTPQRPRRAGGEKADDDDFLTLPAFRMLCLSHPLLETFFAHDLPASFQLEKVVHRGSDSHGVWHDAPDPVLSSNTSASSPPSSSSLPASSSASSDLAAMAAPSTSASPSTSSSSRTYSKDVTTGVRGRIGGLLGTFLGEEAKGKVDELADALGERLSTKVVRGPVPSFASNRKTSSTWASHGSSGGVGAGVERAKGIQPKASSSSLSGANGASPRSPRSGAGNGVYDMDELQEMDKERQRRRRQRLLEEEDEDMRRQLLLQQQQEKKGGVDASLKQPSDKSDDKRQSTVLRGIDLSSNAGAQESIRMATEAILEASRGQTFGEDQPLTETANGADQGLEDEDEDIASLG